MNLARAIPIMLTAFAAAVPAHAQSVGQAPLVSTQSPLSSAPPSGSPGATLVAPGGGIAVPSSPVQVAPMVPVGQVALAVSARLGREQAIGNGLVWRIYADKPQPNGALRLVREDKTATPTFVLPSGGYIVHVAFGLADAVKPVQLRGENVQEVFDLPAGGLRLEGKVGDTRIPAGQIAFEVYKGSQFEPGDKRPLAQGVITGEVLVLPEGAYNLVSNYGDTNAVVRSDIRVQSGKLTDVTVSHRAAAITLKLVAGRGGEAIANTAWSVLTPGGDVIKESIGAFPRVILAEGEYKVIARNEGKLYEQDFRVINGVDSEIEVMAR